MWLIISLTMLAVSKTNTFLSSNFPSYNKCIINSLCLVDKLAFHCEWKHKIYYSLNFWFDQTSFPELFYARQHSPKQNIGANCSRHFASCLTTNNIKALMPTMVNHSMQLIFSSSNNSLPMEQTFLHHSRLYQCCQFHSFLPNWARSRSFHQSRPFQWKIQRSVGCRLLGVGCELVILFRCCSFLCAYNAVVSSPYLICCRVSFPNTKTAWTMKTIFCQMMLTVRLMFMLSL